MTRVLQRLLEHITTGYLVIRDPDGREYAFGNAGQAPAATIVVKHPGFYRRVIREGSLGFGESYMDGWWETDDLASVINVIVLNNVSSVMPRSLRVALHVLKDVRRRVKSSAKRNIQSHYDVGNDFYELFLDENMGYTCGYQLSPDDTIEQMQDQKHELVCRKLQLQPGERIVDLGCGFGGMLRYAAKHYGITGVGYTLSEGQAAWANRKIKEEGLADKIRVELQDYRDAQGEYDKLVSIGMAEHAWDNANGYGTFFGKIQSLIPAGGIGLVHTIGSTDKSGIATDPWITKYIFPGGRIPRLQELMLAANNADITVGHVENLKPHYAETLRHWDEKCSANEEKIRALGPQYDDVFLRMWHFYLRGCEAMFRHGRLQLYQMLFCKGTQWTLPMQLAFGEPRPRASRR